MHTSLSPIRRGLAPGFVNYKKGCTRLAAASNKVYQLLAYCRWFSPASSTTKTGRHDIAEILLKVALNTKNQSINHYKESEHSYDIIHDHIHGCACKHLFRYSRHCCSIWHLLCHSYHVYDVLNKYKPV
jgi:hypothetical protein